MQWLNTIPHWMRHHLDDIAIGLTTMILVVSGPYINAATKGLTRKLHWLLRYTLFVLLSTLGYGILMHFLTINARHTLLNLSDWQFVGAVVLLHLVLAWLLKRDKTI